MEERLGKIVEVEIIRTDMVVGRKGKYKIEGRISGGSFNDSICYVRYKGHTDRISSNKLIAMLHARPDNLDGIAREDTPNCMFGSFVSSEVPEGFVEESYENVVFLGIWEDSMKSERPIPLVKEIVYYFSPAFLSRVLFYKIERCHFRRWPTELQKNKIVPYNIFCERIQIDRKDNRTLRSPDYTFRRYVEKVRSREKDTSSPHPFVVILHNNLLSEMVLNKEGKITAAEAVKSSIRKEGFETLLMEPQK